MSEAARGRPDEVARMIPVSRTELDELRWALTEIRNDRDRAQSSLSPALEALRGLLSALYWDGIEYEHWIVDDEQVQEARAVLDQLEEGERPQTASTEGSSE